MNYVTGGTSFSGGLKVDLLSSGLLRTDKPRMGGACLEKEVPLLFC